MLVTLLAAHVVVVAIYIAWRARSGRPLSIWEPFASFAVVYLLFFVARPFLLFVYPRYGSIFIRIFQVQDGEASGVKAACYSLLCLVAYVLGYLLSGTRRGRLSPLRWYCTARSAKWVFPFFYALVGATAIAIIANRAGGALVLVRSIQAKGFLLQGVTWLYWLGWILEAAVVTGFVLLYRPGLSRRWTLALWSVFVLVQFPVIALGSRENVIVTLVAVLAYHRLNWGRVSARLLTTGLLGLVALGLGFTALRQRLAEQAAGSVGRFGSTVERFTRDLNPYDGFATTIANMPGQLPYLYGETFVGLALYAVPRKLLPDKPTDLGQNRFTQAFYPQWYQAKVTLTNSLLGELYANFGIVWTVLLLGTVGRFHGGLWSRALVPGRSTLFAVTYAFVLGTILRLVRSGIFATTHLFVLHAGPVIFAVYWMSRHGTFRADLHSSTGTTP